jgi:hypothetical protein
MSQAKTSHGQGRLARRVVTPQLMGRAVMRRAGNDEPGLPLRSERF